VRAQAGLRAKRATDVDEMMSIDPSCLNRVKPEETLVEARSGSDVQIDRQIWV